MRGVLFRIPEWKCRFVNDVLHIRESGKGLSRRAPVEGTHGEMVVSAFTDGELLFEVIKGIETVRSIELLVVLSVRSFHLAIVPWRVNSDQLVPDPKLAQRLFKKRFSAGAA